MPINKDHKPYRRGHTKCCAGMTDKEVATKVNKMYQDFCTYRWELSNKSVDRRINLFEKRVFDGYGFGL